MWIDWTKGEPGRSCIDCAGPAGPDLDIQYRKGYSLFFIPTSITNTVHFKMHLIRVRLDLSTIYALIKKFSFVTVRTPPPYWDKLPGARFP
jgi:hypothetical protein